ncbi:MAG: hypothetical protein EPS19_03440 [Candidatus Liberibacter solanacearum]|uniref:hypothetical protein n=1 Tax=Candidatus Liberibacter solanacearum TaxID=556287 RepID=UPI000978EABA|nr:hypothetical protein [Candidatus Liberibacter solanacearum]ONI58637.1 hypothetical protein AYJ09_04430 [Candidatus Liberibacter solanacearum]
MTQLEIGRTFNVIFDTNYFFNEIGLDARLGLHTLLGLNPLLEGGTSWHTSLSPYVNITPRTFLAFPMTLSLTSTSAGIAFGFDIVDDTISVELMGECTDIHHIFAYKLQTSLKYKF